MTRTGPGDWYEPPYPTDGSGNFNTNFCACGGTYKATCAINAWDIQWKQSGTATVGDYCNEMVNMYAPCNSDNGNTVCDTFVDQAGEDIWNDCALGTIDITGSVDTNGVCKCKATSLTAEIRIVSATAIPHWLSVRNVRAITIPICGTAFTYPICIN